MIKIISRNLTIQNNVGLHARPATFFIQKANTYTVPVFANTEQQNKKLHADNYFRYTISFDEQNKENSRSSENDIDAVENYVQSLNLKDMGY